MNNISIKRVYETPSPDDGLRILVDRLWPRGMKKEDVQIDYWFKEVASSNELRKWFGHNPEHFEQFRESYVQELKTDARKRSIVDKLCELIMHQPTTLLFAAKDNRHNNAVVLKEEILRRLEGKGQNS